MPGKGKAEALVDAIADSEPISGLTHNIYRYPGRFSAVFARAAIEAFSDPGDLILDPFVGGGTTLVEASALGRSSLGIDLNELAVFVSQAKTTLLEDLRLSELLEWGLRSFSRLRLRARDAQISHPRHPKHVCSRDSWRIWRCIETALEITGELRGSGEKRLATCAILDAGRQVFDGPKALPSVDRFRSILQESIHHVCEGASEYSTKVQTQAERTGLTLKELQPGCRQGSAKDAVGILDSTSKGIPKLILFSPPYPGIHVLYHRWQIQGRRETSAPYWIIGSKDGNGASYYTMGGRKEAGIEAYFCSLRDIFRSLAGVSNRDTTIVQLVAFRDPCAHLSRYLSIMEENGFSELTVSMRGQLGKRAWRDVPGRRWYNHGSQRIAAKRREVLLVHRLS